MKLTQHDRDVMFYEGARYISRAMPLYVALRRFLNHMEEKSDEFLENPDYLVARALFINIGLVIDSENVRDLDKQFENVAEIAYDSYVSESEKLMPEEPKETA